MTDEEIAKRVVGRLGGWIEHDGGECPIPRSTLVKCRYPLESVEEAEAYECTSAGTFIWSKNKVEEGDTYVVAYRVIKHA